MKKTTEKQKKISKWLLINLLIVLFGISLIANIIYLPKYLTMKKSLVADTISIEIKAYQDEQEKPQLLFDYFYETKMVYLGDLMANYVTYNLQNSQFGRLVQSVSFNGITLSNNADHFWMIYERDNKTTTATGIDLITLKDHDLFNFHYQKF